MKNRIRFNMLDAALILLAVAMLVTLIFRQNIVAAFEKTETVTVEYTFTSETVRFSCAERLPEVKAIYLTDGMTELGKVKEIGKSSATSADPNYVVIQGTATAVAEVRQDGYYLAGKHMLASGCRFVVRDGFSQYEITLTNISEVE